MCPIFHPPPPPPHETHNYYNVYEAVAINIHKVDPLKRSFSPPPPPLRSHSSAFHVVPCSPHVPLDVKGGRREEGGRNWISGYVRYVTE